MGTAGTGMYAQGREAHEWYESLSQARRTTVDGMAEAAIQATPWGGLALARGAAYLSIWASWPVATER